MGEMIVSDVFIDFVWIFDFNTSFIESYSDEILTREFSKINSPFDETHLILGFHAERNLKDVSSFIDRITNYNFKKITVIVDSNVRKIYPQLLSKNTLEKCHIVPIVFFSYWLLDNFKRNNLKLTSWNHSSEKGWFRTGFLSRFTRIEVLKRLYDENLLENMLWSFPQANRQKHSVIDYYNQQYGTIPVNFEEFYTYCIEHAISDNTINRLPNEKEIPQNLLNPFLFTDLDEHFLKNFGLAGFSILAESFDDNVTEKSWMTMLYQNPFIVINKPTTVRLLKDLGFKTFENYLPFSDYVYIEDDNLRLDMIVENIRHFPNIIKENKEKIAEDIQHNFNLCLEYASQTEEQLRKISTILPDQLNELRHGMTILGINIFKNYREREKDFIENKVFLEKYYEIKGESWPAINHKDEFDLLPDQIKQECKNVFNFPY